MRIGNYTGPVESLPTNERFAMGLREQVEPPGHTTALTAIIVCNKILFVKPNQNAPNGARTFSGADGEQMIVYAGACGGREKRDRQTQLARDGEHD